MQTIPKDEQSAHRMPGDAWRADERPVPVVTKADEPCYSAEDLKPRATADEFLAALRLSEAGLVKATRERDEAVAESTRLSGELAKLEREVKRTDHVLEEYRTALTDFRGKNEALTGALQTAHNQARMWHRRAKEIAQELTLATAYRSAPFRWVYAVLRGRAIRTEAAFTHSETVKRAYVDARRPAAEASKDLSNEQPS